MKYLNLYEAYKNLDDVKNIILSEAIGTDDIEIIDFFVKRGYDINKENVFYNATFNDSIFRYFLEKGIKMPQDINWAIKSQLSTENVQKALIDFGYENYINDRIGFNSLLKNDPKYSIVVKRFEDISKYNI